MVDILREFLTKYREDVPPWLHAFEPGEPFQRSAFFSSRIVYYPGSGLDGQPVAAFNSAHAAHCFVYVDYGVSREEIGGQLDHPNWKFRGYHTLARIELSERDLTPTGWTPHIHPSELRVPSDSVERFGFLVILERDSDRDEAHRV